VIQQNLT
jgi:rhodanese-related sulfurtransferase